MSHGDVDAAEAIALAESGYRVFERAWRIHSGEAAEIPVRLA